MHEIIQLDLGTSHWKADGYSTLTVGVWSPYEYEDLEETGRLYFLIVSERASFSERVFQDDPEKTKIELVEYLRNNYPHSYVMKEKLHSPDNEAHKMYLGDFRTMKPFLTSFRELSANELIDFVNEFMVLTECINTSERADFLVHALDENAELHYELAVKLKEIHERSQKAAHRLHEMIHKIKQNTLHKMATELLEKIKNEETETSTMEFEQIAERNYNDPSDLLTDQENSVNRINGMSQTQTGENTVVEGSPFAEPDEADDLDFSSYSDFAPDKDFKNYDEKKKDA